MIDIFVKCLYSNSFTKLDSFVISVQVTLSESIQRFTEKDNGIL